MATQKNPNSLANLKKFSSTYQSPNRGRKPSHLKKYIREHNVSTQDIRLLLGGILANLKTVEEWKEKLADPKVPPIIKIPLKALLQDYQKGKTDTYQFLVQYAFGAPKQEVSMSSTVSVTEMSYEERQEVIDDYIRRYVEANPGVVPGSGDDAAGQAQGVPGRTEEAEQGEQGTAENTDTD